MPGIKISELDWDMLRKGEKWVLFVNEGDFLTVETDKVLLCDETTGIELGCAKVYNHILVQYNGEYKDIIHDGYFAKGRGDVLKSIYYEWCKRKDIRPNSNEGWFKSKEFAAYTEKIGWGRNYVLFLSEIKAK